jgi:hypothetical protein
MKTKDYLHSDLLENKKNDMVFQKTYNLIDKFARRHTSMEAAAFNIKDSNTLEDMEKMNAILYSEEIIELVNYTIENFNKRHTNKQ